MGESTYRVALGVLFLGYVLIRTGYGVRWFRQKKVERRSGWGERVFVRLLGWGQALAVVYVLSDWLDRFHFDLSPWLRVLGGALFFLGDVLLLATHLALDRNWSPLLEIQQGHTLTTHGPYRYVRHPMYGAFFLMAAGTLLLSANWVAGLGFLVPFTLLYRARVPEEERMMADRFGDAYLEYGARTGRLFPRLPGSPRVGRS